LKKVGEGQVQTPATNVAGLVQVAQVEPVRQVLHTAMQAKQVDPLM
jgi:hypothetical protein